MGVHAFPQRTKGARQPEPQSPHDHEPRPEQKPEEEPSNARSLFAEFFGTAALTTVAAGGEVIAAISRLSRTLDDAERPVSWLPE